MSEEADATTTPIEDVEPITYPEETSSPPLDAEGGEDGKENAVEGDDANKSALRDNIERKGKNAYYYAHGHKANGPEWDGKPHPKLLGKTHSTVGTKTEGVGGFEIHKSNITSYAFSDEGKKVRLYVDLKGVGERCPNDDDVRLDHTSDSFCLLVKQYDQAGEGTAAGSSGDRCLSFGKLYGSIASASFRKKVDRIVVTLIKAEGEGEWETVGSKGGA
eukprot:CAMPEP_0183308664 /NCGR_PEP_ID=MMETSP0160_2-20130417/22389_1 /TAXON_ID=2839 ORGANISM="Odontella Sinensis, Strain Grunow 1884" /NCGR_SAMPLE_ID=MMETSP0160_2 /ASSEMBLY_ACC=CAM_ASM_000250 /LENGTH=217 /DNA_ID=CAMNT_0025472535 /DNA_START=108 /DNA_END=761 /DNA_ORIENTATION=+